MAFICHDDMAHLTIATVLISSLQTSARIRRQTPASTNIHRINNQFGSSGTYGAQLPLVSEEDVPSTDDASDNEDSSSMMSSAAQAAALSAFLSVNSSDSG